MVQEPIGLSTNRTRYSIMWRSVRHASSSPQVRLTLRWRPTRTGMAPGPRGAVVHHPPRDRPPHRRSRLSSNVRPHFRHDGWVPGCETRLSSFMYTLLRARPLIPQNERNIREARGLSPSPAADFDFETAFVFLDDRREYGEARYVALGYLAERLHVLCLRRHLMAFIAISFPQSQSSREVARYAKFQAAR